MKTNPKSAAVQRFNKALREAPRGNKTDRELMEAAEMALKSEETMGNAAKPLSFHPVKFDVAVSALLKIKPPAKPQKAEE